MITVNFDDQSSATDWVEPIELFAKHDGNPMWSTIPAGMVATLTITPEEQVHRRDYGFDHGFVGTNNSPALSAATNDLSGLIRLLENGVIMIALPPDCLAGLAPCDMGRFRRHRAFIKVSFEGATVALVVGALKIYRWN